MVGSANINRRGLARDSELNIQAIDREGARRLRLRLWAEHLRKDEEELVDADPVELVDRLWVPISKEVEKLVAKKRGILPALIHPLSDWQDARHVVLAGVAVFSRGGVGGDPAVGMPAGRVGRSSW